MDEGLIYNYPFETTPDLSTASKEAVNDFWNELYKADQNAVKQAAETLISAKQFLEEKRAYGNKN